MKGRYHSTTLDIELPNKQRLMVREDRELLDRSQPTAYAPIKKPVFT